MRALNTLVVVMGVMIVGGIAALAAIMIGRLSHAAPAPMAGFAAPAIDIPGGARIEAMSAGSGRLVLDLVLADGSRRLVVIDLMTGRRLGTIALHPAK